MEKVLFDRVSPQVRFISSVLMGCALLTIGSLIRVPLYPIPFTLQTLALFILALRSSPKQALASVVCYLVFATIGLPVLGGKVNCLWMMGPSGGYLAAFPLAAYLIATMRQKVAPFFSLLIGQMVIFAFGWVWLAWFVGPKAAFLQGVLIFIPSAILKGLSALSYVRWKDR